MASRRIDHLRRELLIDGKPAKESIAQVAGTYGHAEAQTIVENCGNTQILRCSASEIEQLPDLQGFLKFASQLEWRRVKVKPPG